MQVTAVDFVKSPALYLDRAEAEPITIVKGGREIAVLAKPSRTPISDSLLGLLKGSGVDSVDDIRRMRFAT